MLNEEHEYLKQLLTAGGCQHFLSNQAFHYLPQVRFYSLQTSIHLSFFFSQCTLLVMQLLTFQCSRREVTSRCSGFRSTQWPVSNFIIILFLFFCFCSDPSTNNMENLLLLLPAREPWQTLSKERISIPSPCCTLPSEGTTGRVLPNSSRARHAVSGCQRLGKFLDQEQHPRTFAPKSATRYASRYNPSKIYNVPSRVGFSKSMSKVYVSLTPVLSRTTRSILKILAVYNEFPRL